jgi:hypothetical protein
MLELRRGCRPTPPALLHRLRSRTNHLTSLPPPPANYDATGDTRTFNMAGNNEYGDCVFAGETNYKLCIGPATEAPIVEISAAETIGQYLDYNDGLDIGADIGTFLQWMAKVGLHDAAGELHKDGPGGAINHHSCVQLQHAISLFKGVKLGVNADDLQRVYTGTNGWILERATSGSIDHCVELLAYGDTAFCMEICNGQATPIASTSSTPAFVLFTWGTIGIVTWQALRAIIGEAHIRITDPDRGDSANWDPIAAKDYAELIKTD